MMISLTRRAAEKLRVSRDSNKYIRLSGSNQTNNDSPKVNYSINFTNVVNNDDVLYTSYGIKVIVDSETRQYFEDLKVDYIGHNGSGKFVFKTSDMIILPN